MIQITSLTNSFILNGRLYQKGSLTFTPTSNGLSVSNFSASLADIEIDGETFDTMEALQSALDEKVFYNGGGSGSGATEQWVSDNFARQDQITGVNVVSSDSLQFDQTGYYSYTGDTDIVAPLPPNEQATGKRYVIINTIGTGNIQITGDIYEGGMLMGSFDIMPGENYIIYNNGLHWAIIS